MTEETPAALQPALPDLPGLANELAGIAGAAAVVYDGQEPE
jgi:hypothetical protein